MEALKELKYDRDGLIPAIIQDDETGQVLMMGYMNERSLRATIETGKTHFWPRSRQEYWMKGQTSGHIQVVKQISTDCDRDTLLIKVEQTGAACHEGYRSCFFRRLTGQRWQDTGEKVFDPDQVY